MALDRQSIERRDFPIARRGYEIEAVDAHLAHLADEYEEVARRGRAATGGGLAAATAEQVRMIVEAAEQSAADIERDVQLEARQLRQDAREEAERVRGDAGRQARDHVTRVAEAARGLLDRVESMDRELGGLLEGLRGGAQRLSADLSLLQVSVGEVRDAAASAPDAPPGPRPAGSRGGEGPSPPGDTDPAESSQADVPAGPSPAVESPPAEAPAAAPAEPEDLEPAPAEVIPAPVAPDAQPRDGMEEAAQAAAWEPEPSPPPGEVDGARMVALNMALNGVPREDTQHHIEQNFELGDVDSLLDEVYARARR
ncbi:MAG: hypothetical protein AVDCRST_MAG69-1421 [uncultured Solirubrobacteraceae bacterium]|uniref:Antigen 84 n=1 Tax=uncultured Solirubrobacteraceae bacterium TaxID=1162706 RepID=A0A6J4S8E6_9ACTN|nr:MAG: hypothetical protein AVDCRST_MAG69-1421 [uncultured Solirubrobacteraceae bacterium]